MNKLASIEQIQKVKPHPNADLLEIVEICNLEVIVPKDKYVEKEKVVFIWPDSILPDEPWAAFYRAKSSRVRAIRLRGVWSMGVVEKIESVVPEKYKYILFAVGDDMTTILDIQKHEPPPPKDLQAKGNLPFGIPKTDEENHYKFDYLPFGTGVVVSRKRDGSSASFYYKLDTDQFGVMSRSLELKPEFLNAYTEHIARYDIENKLRAYCQKHQVSLCVRGESIGNGRNGHKANVDAKGPSAWEVFSVWDIDQRRYIRLHEEHNFIKVAEECGFAHVPILESGVTLTEELVRHYTEDKIGFEGVVIHTPNMSFKCINKVYDSLK